MDRLLASPEFQALAPFVAALVLLAVLRKAPSGWNALALTGGLAVIVALVNGLTVEPLTGTRKIMILALAAAPVGLLVATVLHGRARMLTYVVLCVAGGAWVFWTVLARKDELAMALFGGGAVAYLAWLTAAMYALRAQPLAAGAAATALALGTGASVLLSASALLGQLGLALGAAAGAFLLFAAFLRDQHAGAAFTLTAALGAGLIGFAGLLFAKLDWLVLLPLALVPLAARVPAPERLPRFLQAALVFACAAAPAAVAVLGTLALQQDSGGY